MLRVVKVGGGGDDGHGVRRGFGGQGGEFESRLFDGEIHLECLAIVQTDAVVERGAYPRRLKPVQFVSIARLAAVCFIGKSLFHDFFNGIAEIVGDGYADACWSDIHIFMGGNVLERYLFRGYGFAPVGYQRADITVCRPDFEVNGITLPCI